MHLSTFKWLSAFIIYLTTLIGNILPMYITALKWTSRLESLAGGVFLGAGLAHLLADSLKELQDESSYPIGAAVCLATFVILTFVDLFSYGEHDEEFKIIDQPLVTIDGEQSEASVAQPELFSQHKSNISVAIMSLYVIMCVHSTIEGVALGILPKWTNTIAIFIAIVGHKPVEAFALSLVILKGKPTRLVYWTMIAIYVSLTPIGTIAAIYLGEIASKMTLGVIAAFSAGTFLFVGCHETSEMFEHKTEWSRSEKGWHFSMFAMGVIWMLLIAIIEALYPED